MKCSTIGGRGGGKNPYTVQVYCTLYTTPEPKYTGDPGVVKIPQIYIYCGFGLCAVVVNFGFTVYTKMKKVSGHTQKKIGFVKNVNQCRRTMLVCVESHFFAVLVSIESDSVMY